jgi:GT2 family glycosyltransferase
MTATVPARARIGVAIASRDRRALVLATVARLRALPERPPVVVADDASRDGTAAALRARSDHGDGVEVVALSRPAGAAARTAAIERLATPYVALSDDDSWWDPGALALAVELFDRHPRLGLVAAAVVVGPGRRPDPTCAAMAASPLATPAHAPSPALGTAPAAVPARAPAAAATAPASPAPERDLPGVPVLGFVACGAIVRRDAYLAVGGFHPRFGVGGEERLLALDLRAAGWAVRYVPEVVAHHCPPPSAGRPSRRAATLRNDLWTVWLRRRRARLPAATDRCLRAAGWDRGQTARGLLAAVRGLPWVVRERRALPAPVERDLTALESNLPPG